MRWRVDTSRSVGAKAEPVAVLEIGSDELELLQLAVAHQADDEDFDQINVDLSAANLALARGDVGKRGGKL